MPLLHTLAGWDGAALAWLTRFHHPFVDHMMIGLTAIGRASAVWLAITAALVAIDRRRLRGAIPVLVALALAHVLTDVVIKPLVARPRPFEGKLIRVIDVVPETYSFPSGHAATAFAGAATLSSLWPQGRVVLWPLAVLIALSRLYLGVHYPLDVVGGALLGLACAWAARRTTKSTKDAKDKKSATP